LDAGVLQHVGRPGELVPIPREAVEIVRFCFSMLSNPLTTTSETAAPGSTGSDRWAGSDADRRDVANHERALS
jgi:hypothetical protein